MTPEELEYTQYLEDHISNVLKGYDFICEHLPELIPTDLEISLRDHIEGHDQSKYSDEEYSAYANYYYGKKTKDVKNKFAYAWLHHIHNNPHHWQYWMLQNDDDGLDLLEIPYEYIIEMICDWWAFSWKSGNLLEIFDWYKEHKKNIIMNDNSRNKVEEILESLKGKLDKLKFGRIIN